MDAVKSARMAATKHGAPPSTNGSSRTTRQFPALAFAAGALLALSHQAAALNISGNIASGTGAAVAGATVNLISGGTLRTATTDAAGNYAVTGLTNGSWIVKPTKISTYFSPDSILLYAQTSNASMNFVASTPTTAYTAKDIGAVSGPGSSNVQGNIVVMSSLGTALGGGLVSMDALHFYHTGVRGDGDLVAKILNMTGGGSNAEVGIMLRENTAPNSRMTAFVLKTHQASQGDRPLIVSRMTPGMDTPNGGCWNWGNNCAALDVTQPVWLKIRRQANDFLFYWSNDGASWNFAGTSTVAMSQNLLAGAVLVGGDGTVARVGIEQLAFVPNSAPLIAHSSSVSTATVGTSINLAANVSDADGNVSSVQYFVNGSRVGIASVTPYQISWNTVGLPAGKYLVTAKATDDKGSYRYSIQSTVNLTGTTAARLNALLVVKSATLSAPDAVLFDRLNALGFNVTVKTDVAAVATDTVGKSVVVLAPSALPDNVGTKFKATKNAVLVANPALYANMGMTGSVQGTDWGFAASKDSLNLVGCDGNLLNWSINGGVNRNNGVANCHELTAGLFGKRQVQRALGNVSWAKPSAAAKVAASLDNDATKAAIFSYAPGVAMAANFAAPGRRAGIWMDTVSGNNLSDNGRALFDAAVYWAAQARTPILKKIFVINYEPILATRGGQLMHVYKGWADPHASARDYLNDLTEASGGYVRWQLADFKDVNGMPVNNTGYVWNETNILAAIDNGVYPPGGADYDRIIDTYGLDLKVQAGQVDEVVMYGPGGSGFDESHMAGQTPYYVNGALTYRANTPNFVMMGLNSDRLTAEALESFGHRTEAIMSNVMGWAYSDCDGYPDFRLRNAWEQFASNAKTVVVGQPTGLGNAHYSPVTPQDYDWAANWYKFPDGPFLTANTFADDWAANYPYLKGTTNIVDARTWDPMVGTSASISDRGFKRWWLGHMPRVLGSTIDGTLEKRRETVNLGGVGYSNNWWDYLVDINRLPESRSAQSQSCRESFRTPDVATGLVATPHDGEVTLTWNAAQGATGYDVEKSTDGINWTSVYAINGPIAWVYALTNGVPVSFRVKSHNDVGTASPSAVVTATPGSNAEPCSPAIVVSGGQSGNFNASGSVCYKTSETIHGWGCSEFAGRTMKVNGVAVACSQLPVPAPVGGYNYFEASAGTYSWASLYWW